MTVRETGKTLLLLRYTYRVNAFFYALKQVPLVKRVLPEKVYANRELKSAVTVLGVLFGILTTLARKAGYVLLAFWPLGLFERELPEAARLQVLLLLAVLGAYIYTDLYEPTADRSYVIFLLRMDAKACVLTWLGYDLLHVLVGFWLPAILLSLVTPLSVIWLLFPFFVVGVKILGCAAKLKRFQTRGGLASGWQYYLPRTLAVAGVLVLAYGLPYGGLVLPGWVLAAGMLLVLVFCIPAVFWLLRASDYRAYCQAVQVKQQRTTATSPAVAQQSRKAISTDVGITSNREGLAYLHDLFVKRHRKLLWRASGITALICAGIFAVTGLLVLWNPSCREEFNPFLRRCLPMMPFFLYFLNRGSGFTQALFMNCDHSLLTYSFFKQPGNLLRLFRLRLVEIVKVNLLHAAVIAVGMTGLLALSGGADTRLDYVVLPVTTLALNIFFSVHYLTIYYLLQPYHAGLELKSGTYTMVSVATYIVCLVVKEFPVSNLWFGVLAILFCTVYCIGSCLLIYRVAPRTFRLRM